MARKELLEEIRLCGLKKSAIAEKMEITHATFLNKLKGDSSFNVYEALILMQIIGKSADDIPYFFDLNEEKKRKRGKKEK